MNASRSQNSPQALRKHRTGRQSARHSAPSLLPGTDTPKVAHASLGGAADLGAILAVVPDSPAEGIFDGLPEVERWQELNARAKPRAGTVRTTTLANRGQTLVVLGYVAPQASTFERLSLAGRMLKEAASRNPESIGLIALGEPIAAREALDAVLAASLAQAFQLPAFRAPATEEHVLRRVDLLSETGSKSGGAPRRKKSTVAQAATPKLSTATIAAPDVIAPQIDIPYALAAGRGNNLVRWLTALPPNMLDARGYRSTIAKLAKTNGLGMNWLDERALRRAGANAFLAVSAANGHRDAGIAHLTYRPARGKTRGPATNPAGNPDIALVGKGILFDTGGVNLKPHRSMLDMHIDMSGSAVALATLLALAELRAPIAADAWLAITENQIGPNAFRPQEVVRASNGVTIQVIHTDAEGRMVLADTLALAGRTRPRLIVDFATLTGAAVYSLTDRMSAVLTNRPGLVPTLVEAGRTSGERVWNFPFDADYDTDLESKVADILQCSVDGKGDHILATRFLSRFVPEDIAWAHVDLAAATRTGGLGHINTDITGFGVRYALELILKHDVLAAVERTK